MERTSSGIIQYVFLFKNHVLELNKVNLHSVMNVMLVARGSWHVARGMRVARGSWHVHARGKETRRKRLFHVGHARFSCSLLQASNCVLFKLLLFLSHQETNNRPALNPRPSVLQSQKYFPAEGSFGLPFADQMRRESFV